MDSLGILEGIGKSSKEIKKKSTKEEKYKPIEEGKIKRGYELKKSTLRKLEEIKLYKLEEETREGIVDLAICQLYEKLFEQK